MHTPESAMRRWVEEVVVGLNFCPFAKKEMLRDSIRYCVSGTQDTSSALTLLIDEINRLDLHPEIETTLLVFSEGFSDYPEYLDLLSMADALVASGGYAGVYQLASFHPDYLFEGEDVDSPSHFTNRSPYPALHLLRESSISRVMDGKESSEHIVDRNIAVCEKLGAQSLSRLLAALKR